jgi:Zn-dependent peptidase ImmA (M78 family)/DNA-binding XRE family transcriptional regulator
MEAELGARIRALREAVGLQAQELAAEVGLDPTALSKIENGRRAVKSAELARIADALRLSPLALLEDDSLLARLPMAARRAGRSITEGGAFERLLSLTELHVVLSESGIHSSSDFGGKPDVSDLAWLDAAAKMAEYALTKVGVEAEGDQRLGAVADAIEDRFKVDVLIERFDGDALSGAALTDPQFPLVFVNADFSRPRSLFTLAHELGHLLLGHVDENIALDRELAGSTDIERMANAFAAMYLMPEDRIRQCIDNFGRFTPTIVHMAYVFGVSFETVVYRLHNLQMINADGRDRLMRFNWQQQLARLAVDPASSGLSRSIIGKMQTRANLKPAGRLPALLVRRAYEGYEKGVISIRPLAGLLGEDPESLLIHLSSDNFDSERDALNTDDLGADAQSESAEVAFAGSPV